MEQSYSSFHSPFLTQEHDIQTLTRTRSKSDADQMAANLSFEDYKNRKSLEKPREKSQKLPKSPEKYALNILRMTPTQFARYQHAFGLLDLSDMDKISRLDFEKVLGFFGLANDLSQARVKECFLSLDRDGDKHFTLVDFLREINNQKMFRLLTQLIKGLISKEDDINNYRKEEGKPIKSEVQIPYEEEEEDYEDDFGLSSEVIQANPQRYAKAILNIDDQDYINYKKAFDLLDSNSFGYVTKERFLEVMDTYQFGKEMSKGELNFLFNKMDRDFDGEINFLDLLKSVKRDKSNRINKLVENLLQTLESKKGQEAKDELDNSEIREAFLYAKFEWKMEENYLRKLFKVFKALDINNQNFITKADFDEILMKYSLIENLTIEDFEKVFNELDIDNDGKINFMEFILGLNTNTYSLKAREILNRIFEKEDRSLIILEKEKSHEEISPTKEGKESVLEQKEATKEKDVEKIGEEPKRMKKEEGLDEEVQRKLKYVEKDVTDLNRHMQRDMMLLEERYLTDIEILKRTILQKDEIITERNVLIDRLNRENKELAREKDELVVKSQGLEKDFQISQATLSLSFNEKEQEIFKENQKLQEKLRNLEKVNEYKTKELERLENEAKESSHASSMNTRSLLSKVDQLNDQVYSLMKENRQMEDERKQLNENIQNLEREKVQLCSALNEVKKDIEIVYRDEDERKSQIEELCKKLESSIEPETYRAVLREREFLSSENVNIKAELSVMKKNMEIFGQEKRKLKEKVQELEKDRARLYETCNKVNEDLKMLADDVEGFEEREKNHLAEIDDLKRQFDNSIEETKRLRKENEQLYTQLQETKRLEKKSGEKIRVEDQMELIKDINEFEGSLKRLQQREGEYSRHVGALSEEISAYTLDTEKLKIDNSLLQDRITTLQEELAQQKSHLTYLQGLNRKITSENSSMRNDMARMKEDRQKYLHEIQNLHDNEHRLKEDLEKLKLDYQSLKIRNLVLDDKANMLEREKMRLDDLYRRSSLKQLSDITPSDIENLNKQIRELRKENVQLRQKLDEIRIEEQQQEKAKKMRSIRFSKVLRESEKENKAPQIREGEQSFRTPQGKGLQGDSGYSGAIEKLKEELKNVKESREAILNSLEKERLNIKGVIQDTSQPSYSEKKTPIKRDLFGTDKMSTMESGSKEIQEPTARKTEKVEFTTRSAPETIKKIGTRTTQSFSSPQNIGKCFLM